MLKKGLKELKKVQTKRKLIEKKTHIESILDMDIGQIYNQINLYFVKMINNFPVKIRFQLVQQKIWTFRLVVVVVAIAVAAAVLNTESL